MKLTTSIIEKTLNYAYTKALSDIPGLDSAYDMAEEYSVSENKYDNANKLIRWQIAKCATSGFLTGIPGLLAMPVTIPANFASVWYVQLRMIAAIAIMAGYDVKSDKVKTLAFCCLVGSSAADVGKQFGIKAGQKIAENLIKKIPGQLIMEINQQVGFRLLTKFGEKGLVNLGKCVPVFGGLLSGTIDAISTNTIGNIARDVFIGKQK